MLPETFSLSNAAGWIKSYNGSFENLLRSPVTHITAGSFTQMLRDGNPEPRYWSERGPMGTTSINSLGLPNPGMVNIGTHRALQAMQSSCTRHGKKLRISIAGFRSDEFLFMSSLVQQLTPEAECEFNFGCPNVIAEGKHKSIFSFNVTMMEEVLILCAKTRKAGTKIAVKVSPFSDPIQLRDVATLCNEWQEHIDTVVTCNIFPNAMSFAHEKPTISGKGYGGLAGEPLKHIMLGQVAQFREHLDPTIRIIAVGGIQGGQDVKDALMAGADGIQIGTAYFHTDDPRIFSRVLEEYAALV